MHNRTDFLKFRQNTMNHFFASDCDYSDYFTTDRFDRHLLSSWIDSATIAPSSATSANPVILSRVCDRQQPTCPDMM
jgi:hypothetical protein